MLKAEEEADPKCLLEALQKKYGDGASSVHPVVLQVLQLQTRQRSHLGRTGCDYIYDPTNWHA